MVELEVEGIRMDGVSQTPILLLREVGGARCLPIWIGASEAAAIAQGMDGVEPPRPLTHDLLARVLLLLADDPPQLSITGLDDGVWFGQVQVGASMIDARPSDLVALSLRLQVPVRCPASLLEQAGVILDGGPQDEVEKFREFLDQVSPDDFED